jgi:type II secretory pathway component PulC
MKILRTKTMMQVATVSLWLLSAGIVVWACTTTASIPTPAPVFVKPTVPTTREDDPQNAPDAAANRWERLFARRFQRPLFDPPPAAPPPVEQKVVPPPPIQVMGTMVEKGGGSAMIKDDKGVTSFYSVGASITAGGTTAKLLNVYEDRVELEHEGKVITIMLSTKKTD